MSIAARPSRLDPAPGSWLGGDRSIGTSQPPADLLPDGGSLAPAPASTPERVLAQDALRLLRLVVREDQSPEVETVRRQLDPIRSRRSLAASYRQEAVNRGSTLDPDTKTPGVVRLAYARRWLELGPDRR